MSKRKRCQDNSDDESDLLVSVEDNKIMFYCEINSKSIFKLIQCIDKAKKYVKQTFYKKKEPIYLHISSDGGVLFNALSAIDTILNSEIDIITICEGCVSSAGVLIALAGKKRYITEHSYMLIHEIRSGCNGKYTECIDDMKNNDILMNDMIKYMNKRCNNKLLKRELPTILKHDIIWDSKKCLKYGLVDEIL